MKIYNVIIEQRDEDETVSVFAYPFSTRRRAVKEIEEAFAFACRSMCQVCNDSSCGDDVTKCPLEGGVEIVANKPDYKELSSKNTKYREKMYIIEALLDD